MSLVSRMIIGPALIMRVFAGPFPSDAVAAADPRFSIWASTATVNRGLVDIAYPDEGSTTYGSAVVATGPADATANSPYPVVSLGDGGSAELSFTIPFGDVPGPDFAVFENGFSSGFLELAYVEVSSDGVSFYRFPATSLTPVSPNLGQGSAVDPTNVRNLAGKYVAGLGTPFDLAELRLLYPALDTQRIIRVRVIDAIGTNDPVLASRDAGGRIVADPYPTPYTTGGFDLDAVGAFQATTTTYASWLADQRIVNTAVNTAVNADPDHNGVQNGIEYLTGTGWVEITGTTLHFSHLSYRTGGNLKLEASADCREWTTLAVSNNGAAMQTTSAAVVTESGDFRKEVSVQLPPNGTYQFFRLAAELGL